MFAPQPQDGASSQNEHIPVFSNQKATGHFNSAICTIFWARKSPKAQRPACESQLGKDLEPRTHGKEENSSLPPGSRAGLPLNGTKSISGAGVQIPLCSSSGWTRPWTNGALFGVKTGHRGTRRSRASKHLSKHGLVFACFLQSLLAKLLGLPRLVRGPWLVPVNLQKVTCVECFLCL